MSNRFRVIMAVVAGLFAIWFIVLFLLAPKSGESSSTLLFGKGAADIMLIIQYGLPVITLLALSLISFRSVLGKRHVVLEAALTLAGRSIQASDVEREGDKVEAKRQAVLTHQLTCPLCRGGITYIDGVLPIRCEVVEEHFWPHERALWDAMVAVGEQADADKLARVVHERANPAH